MKEIPLLFFRLMNEEAALHDRQEWLEKHNNFVEKPEFLPSFGKFFFGVSLIIPQSHKPF